MTTLDRLPFAALPPIGLDELVQQAELLTRVDRKYVVRLSEMSALFSSVPAGTRVLQIGDQRDFGYRSTYLDTPDFRSFHTSGRSHRHRWKVRGRSYLDSGDSWLETKTAGPRGRTTKTRIVHDDPLHHGISPAGAAFVSGRLGPELTDALRPVLTTTYRRTTLLLPQSRTRVTIDVELAWTAVGSGRSLRRPGLAVVETKTGSTPSVVDRHMWSSGHRPVRISKYGVGMAALDPNLPRLKWHRALQHRLDVPASNRPWSNP